VLSVTGFKSYVLLGITVSYASWVTLYTSHAAALADLGRPIGVDPAPGTGVIAESITTSPGSTYFSPAVIGYNLEAPVTDAIAIRLSNNGVSSENITITLSLLQLE
jgi:hypothetical protein